MKLSKITGNLLKGDFSALFEQKDKGRLHPVEMAHVLNSLPGEALLPSFTGLSYETQVEVFPYLDPLVQKKLVTDLPKENASEILNTISSDDRVSFFSALNHLEIGDYLDLLQEENRKATLDMLGFSKQSVARLINTEYATLKKDMTIGEALEYLRKHQPDTETANVVYVVDDRGKLIEDIPLRRLVLNDPAKKIEEVMDKFCLKLDIDDTKESAIEKFKQYDRTVLPVTNKEDVLMGVITIDDIMDEEEKQATREIQKFGGMESLDYPYVKTPFFSLVKKRAGWLIILFVGEMLTATAMGYFDKEIAKAVVLALFVPLIISSGGNSGSQAATLIIRAMAVKELSLKDWWYVMRREIGSGITLGIVLGSIGFLRITIWQEFHWYNYGQYWPLLALTIFFSLIGIVMWGTLTGSMIPMILKKCKLDPAASSAPFVATLVDVTGLIIYFSIAAILLKGTILKG
ncbi:MAG TPA: magnesium transporter [Flavisolibacter sp.]|nr:magnesium transporter [Flavisolibacter sp.]